MSNNKLLGIQRANTWENIVLFKKRLKGTDYADMLIYKVSRDVYDNWDDICAQIKEVLPDSNRLNLDDKVASYVIVAIITMELQVIKNLGGEKYFSALEKHVFNKLCNDVEWLEAKQIYDTFLQEWYKGLANEDELSIYRLYGLASALCDAMNLPLKEDFSGQKVKGLSLLSTLDSIVMSYTGFSKFLLENYKIKPDK